MHSVHWTVIRASAIFLLLAVTSGCWWGRDRRDAHYGDHRDGHEDRHDEHR
jgi:hypothetical protein